MISLLKKVFFMGIFILLIGYSFAQQQPAAFIVQIEPSSFDVNIPVDVTIKAVKSNGDVIKDYEGDVFIDVEGTNLDTTDYTVPSEGLYTFVPQDQGSKTFSKGLIIKKSGTFTIILSDINEDSIKGEKTVIVGSKTDSTEYKKIIINSPAKSSIEKSEVLEVIGIASELPNSSLEIFINSQLAYQGQSSSAGEFTAYITGLQKGENTIQAKILDINNTILGESDIISFSYESPSDGTFKNIQVLPSNIIREGTKLTFKVSTSDSVTSTTIKLSNGRSAPMDLISAGSFSKDLLIDSAGKISVSLDLLVNGQKKEYIDVTKLLVQKGTKIGKIRIFGDSVYKNKLTLTWDIEGAEAAKYTIAYGNKEDNLNQSSTVSKKEIVMENLTLGQTYYFSISPIDDQGKLLGPSSDIVQATIGESGDSGETTCVIQGITVTDTKIGDKHYLIRSGVQNVEKYIIYRSETNTSDVSKMQKISEVTDTKFEYPFNKASKQDKYAYFVVQAICKDGKALVIQDVKKVKTGPLETTLLFIFIAILFYGGYKLSYLNK